MTGGRRQLAMVALSAVAAVGALCLSPVTSGLATPQTPDPKSEAAATVTTNDDTISFRADQQAGSAAIRDELARLPGENGGLSANGPGQVTIHLLADQLAPSTAVQTLMTRAEAVGVPERVRSEITA